MIKIDIPGFGHLNAKYLVLDYNGTLAIDGEPIAGVGEKLNELAHSMEIHVVTADTFNKASVHLGHIKCHLEILHGGQQQLQKSEYINKLGNSNVIAIGNGMNDALMLKDAALGIVVVQKEGASSSALFYADIVCHSVHDALDLLTNPRRMTATLRN